MVLAVKIVCNVVTWYFLMVRNKRLRCHQLHKSLVHVTDQPLLQNRKDQFCVFGTLITQIRLF